MTTQNQLLATDFLRDLVPLIKQNLKNAKSNNSTDDFSKGLTFAYYDVLSIIQMQAEVFEIDLATIKLKQELTELMTVSD